MRNTGNYDPDEVLDAYEIELMKQVREMRAGLAQNRNGTILGTLRQSRPFTLNNLGI